MWLWQWSRREIEAESIRLQHDDLKSVYNLDRLIDVMSHRATDWRPLTKTERLK